MTSQLPSLLPGTVLLETGRPDGENQQSLLFRDPVEVLRAYRSSEVPDLLRELDDRLERGLHVAGYLDYECGYAFESFEEFVSNSRPIAWFGVYAEPELWPVFERDRWDPDLAAQITAPSFSWKRDAYEKAFERTKSHLFEGDVYQINLTGKFRFDYDGPLGHLYRLLKQRQGVAYNALIVTESDATISCSPELFFRREGSRIWTRPMKGTIDRGRTPDEDRERIETLVSDPKTQAENLMIVDLLRNDLSRVCKHGSVEVTELFSPERYDTVIQLTSTVEAELRPDIGYSQLFSALFPCGSVTGAPKIRAMQVIRDIEEHPRGVYTGAIGFAGPGDKAVFSVAIRTLALAGGEGEMGSGGGIVWDSNHESEYEECLLKARFLRDEEPRFQLIETLRYDRGIQRLERHMDRLLSSADYFGFAIDPRIVLKRLEEAVESHPEANTLRLRLVLSKDGSVTVDASAPESFVDAPTVVISGRTVDSSDRFLYHKTTKRSLYEAAYTEAREAGHMDVLFLNERGEVCEGSRSNVYARKDGRMVTPPISSGLLAGTVRTELLEAGDVSEEVLHRSDLVEADAVYISNAILGLVEVTLVLE